MKRIIHGPHLRIVASIVFCLFILQQSVMMQTAKKPLKQTVSETLVPGKPVEHEIKPSESHSYTIDLKANQFLRVLVDQRGADVVISFYGPGGDLLEERDRTNGSNGEESLSAQVSKAGRYRIQIRLFDRIFPEPGMYEIGAQMRRAATAEDKKRITAERFFQEGVKLRSQNKKETKPLEIANYEKALPIWRELGDRYAEGLTLSIISETCNFLEEADKAIDNEAQALVIFTDLRETRLRESSLHHLARLWHFKRDFERAAYYYEELAKTNRGRDREGNFRRSRTSTEQGFFEADDPLIEAATMTTTLGGIQARNGAPQKAIETYQRAILLYRRADFGKAEADLLNLIGKLYYDLGDNVSALDHYNRALKLFTEQDDSIGEMRVRRNIRSIDPQSSLHAELVVQTGHSSIDNIFFSPDGRILVSEGAKDSIKLWDAKSGNELKTLTVRDIVFSPDGKLFAAKSGDGITLWDTESLKEIRRIARDGSGIMSIAFSPDRRTLASSATLNVSQKSIGSIKLWDIESGQEIKTLLGGSSDIWTIAFSPDGKMIASGSYEGKVEIWDTESGRKTNTIQGHSDYIWTIAFSFDGKYLASQSDDKTVKLWNVESGAVLKTISANSFVFSPDRKTLATISNNNKIIKLWDLERLNELRTLSGQSITFSPNGKIFASIRDDPAGADGKTIIELWDSASENELRTLPGTAIAFDPSGNSFASVENCNCVIKQWEIGIRKEPKVFTGHSASIKAMAFGGDGKTLISVADVVFSEGVNKVIRLWDLVSGTEPKILTKPSDSIQFVAFCDNGKVFATVKKNDNAIKIWDMLSGNELRVLQGGTGSAWEPKFSPDGTILVSYNSAERVIKLWDVDSGKELRQLPVSPRGDAVFSPDSKTLATFEPGDKRIKLWEVNTGKLLKILSGHTDLILSINFSPDGESLVSGAKDNTVRLWDTRTGTLRQTRPRSFDRVSYVTFNADGNRIASLGAFSSNLNEFDEKLNVMYATYFLNRSEPANGIADIYPEFYKAYFGAAISRDLLAAPVEDNKIKLFSKETRKEIATLIALDQYNWTIIEPYGRFDASKGAQKSMHFVLGLEPIDFEQIKDRYYEPGLLSKIINKKPFRVANIQPFAGNELYPSVEYEPLKQGQKNLSVHLVNRGGGIGAVQVFVNENIFLLDARPGNFDPKQREATLDIDFSKAAFKPGEENKIKIVARNSAGWLRSRGSESLYTAEGKKRTDPPELYAIVAGVSDYAESDLNLKYAAKDAEDFAHALELGAMRIFGKDKVHIRLLSSGAAGKEPVLRGPDSKQLDPTKEGFKRSFEEFRKAVSTDIFVVYLSGHATSIKLEGETGDTYLYLMDNAVTTNAERLKDEKLRNDTTLSSVELVQLIKEIHAEKQAMILDTCAAGAAANILVEGRDITDEQTYQIRAIDRLKDLTGFYVLMGSAKNAQSYEATRYGQGLLTYSLLEAMQGAKLDASGYAFVNKLFEFALERVPEMANGVGGVQEPRILAPSSQDFFIGQFTDIEKKQIVLAKVKPVLLNPQFQNENLLFDNLGLSTRLIKAFHNASSVKRSGRDEARIVFYEADSTYNAIKPSGRYEISGDNIKLTIVLVKNNETKGAPIVISGDINNMEELIKRIVEAVIEASQML